MASYEPSQETLDNVAFSNFGYYAVVAFLGYEYFITLDMEVALFWKKHTTGAGILFFFNRYYTLLWAVAEAATPYYTSPKRFAFYDCARTVHRSLTVTT
ncbi:hypothetical protein BD309DRAFT_863465 [Dichomitus squalens]|uniref:DUF6533 domain-containing protein n=1 Tax=Dichomitus squalens TaxID=114155 RepID=A0A4Q9NW51_9APHY|nr:hypothetical protein BD311DRAFT_673311 [Dichomitus squalens]TBU43836.1 hypothetical protein BD309DRAFT_863465 [Dichomitus squalens]TBU61788.1 hypothetical protein BD310DRAFT_812483 [Dichomitus squalens]